MEPQSKVRSCVPSVALVINFASSDAKQTAARIPLLGKFEMPTTWVIEEPRQSKMLADRMLARAGHELALTVEARSPQRLRSELANFQSAVQDASGQKLSVVVGDPQQLRSRTALLADLGIGAVVSGVQPSGPAKPPRLLPCGLWQFDPTMNIPQPRHRWSWLTARRPTLKNLLAAETSCNQKVLAFDLGRMNSRELHGCERLLQEIAEAAGRRQLQVETVSKLAAELASRREVKPQRSILRRAA
ncbi:MAG: hypothetical protein GXP24_04190 [Planctomycetes bacterium]|nr:hypothetical protein [Planctomycetota bacterium]